MKKILSLLMVCVLSLGFTTGCAKSEASDKAKVGLIVSTLNNPFFVKLKEGAEAKAEKLGYELLIMDSQNDPAKEVSNMEDMTSKGVSIVLLNPVDSDAAIAAIQVANNLGTPVITLDRMSNAGDVVTHIASDNVAGGVMAAKYIIEQLGGEGNVVELEGTAGSSATRDRGAGFNKGIKDANFNVVAKQTADFDRTKGLSVMENILQGKKDIKAVFAHNDEMALGAAKAVKAAGLNTIVIGFDGNEDAKEAVDKNEMKATIAQQPQEIGALGVELASDIYDGQKVDKTISADVKVASN